jgi:hypothetical protein
VSKAYRMTCALFVLPGLAALTIGCSTSNKQAPASPSTAGKCAQPQAAKGESTVRLPPAVDKAFKDAFPHARIEKLDAEKEDGVMVYDFEFKNGAAVQEADIAADGTILETTLVVEAQDVPAPAMKAIDKAAGGAKVTRIEKIDLQYEAEDGKVVKLARPVTHYAAEFSKGGKTAEVVVTPDGTPVKE